MVSPTGILQSGVIDPHSVQQTCIEPEFRMVRRSDEERRRPCNRQVLQEHACIAHQTAKDSFQYKGIKVTKHFKPYLFSKM